MKASLTQFTENQVFKALCYPDKRHVSKKYTNLDAKAMIKRLCEVKHGIQKENMGKNAT